MSDDLNTIFEKLGEHTSSLKSLVKNHDKMEKRVDRTYYMVIANFGLGVATTAAGLVTYSPATVEALTAFIFKLLA